MLNYWKTYYAQILCVFLIVGLTVWGSWHNFLGNEVDKPANKQKEPYANGENDARADFSIGDFFTDLAHVLTAEEWIAVGTIALVLVTGLLGFVAYLQIRTTRAQLRAYLTIGTDQGTGMVITQNRKLRFECRPFILNSGQTPAMAVRVSARTIIMPAQFPVSEQKTFNFKLIDENPDTTYALGPNQWRFCYSFVAHRATMDELRALLKGTLVLFVYGTVRYKDIFRRKHSTNFAYMVEARRRGSLWRAIIYHNDGN